MKWNKKEILSSSITFRARYYRKNINILNKSLTNCLFSLQCNVANFVFSFEYRQQKVDFNTSQKLLVLVSRQHRKFHFYVNLSYTKSYLRKNTHLQKNAAFISLRLKEISKIYISWKQKHMETNKKSFFHTVQRAKSAKFIIVHIYQKT